MITGSCLCGGVAFTIDGRLTPIQICHARRCQKFTGSAFSPEMGAKNSALSWLRGQELISIYEAPLLNEPPPLRRAFCQICGSPLPVALEGTDYVVLLAGVLDGDPGTRPFRHIHMDQRAAWEHVDDELPQFHTRAPADQQLPRSSSSKTDD